MHKLDFFKINNLYNQIQNGSLSKIRYVPTAIICMCSRIFKSGISRKETYSGKTINIFFCLLHIFCFIYNFFLFLQLQYNENPEDFRSEVTTFTSLRNESCVKILTNSDIGLKNLKRYYCQLAFFRNRFKVLDSPLMKKGPFDFPWSEADDDLLTGKFYTIFWRIILIFSFWLLLRFL